MVPYRSHMVQNIFVPLVNKMSSLHQGILHGASHDVYWLSDAASDTYKKQGADGVTRGTVTAGPATPAYTVTSSGITVYKGVQLTAAPSLTGDGETLTVSVAADQTAATSNAAGYMFTVAESNPNVTLTTAQVEDIMNAVTRGVLRDGKVYWEESNGSYKEDGTPQWTHGEALPVGYTLKTSSGGGKFTILKDLPKGSATLLNESGDTVGGDESTLPVVFMVHGTTITSSEIAAIEKAVMKVPPTIAEALKGSYANLPLDMRAAVMTTALLLTVGLWIMDKPNNYSFRKRKATTSNELKSSPLKAVRPTQKNQRQVGFSYLGDLISSNAGNIESRTASGWRFSMTLLATLLVIFIAIGGTAQSVKADVEGFKFMQWVLLAAFAVLSFIALRNAGDVKIGGAAIGCLAAYFLITGGSVDVSGYKGQNPEATRGVSFAAGALGIVMLVMGSSLSGNGRLFRLQNGREIESRLLTGTNYVQLAFILVAAAAIVVPIWDKQLRILAVIEEEENE